MAYCSTRNTGTWLYEDANWLNRTDFWPVGGELVGTYRVVFWVSRLNAILGGFTPRSYHTLNIAIHTVNGLLVAWVAGWARRPVAALVSSGIFLLHPLQVESVAYVTGRSELLLGSGLLVGLIAIRAETPTFATGCLAAMAGLWALGAKPSGITAPALMVMGARFEWRRCWLPVALWACAAAIVVPHMAGFLSSPFTSAAGVSRATYAWRQIVAVTRYAGMVWVPVGQSIDHDPEVAGVAILGAFGWLMLLDWWPTSRPIIGLLAVWVIVALAPRFLLRIPEYVNEHQWYVPMIGVSLALGGLADAATA